MKLRDIAKFNPENITKKDNYLSINYLDTANITEGEIDTIVEYNIDEAPSRAKRKAKNGDIIYSTVRPNLKHYGLIKESPENLIVSTGFSVIRCNNNINKDFVYEYLTLPFITSKLASIAEGSVSTYPSIRPKDLENIEIKLPSLDNQNKITYIYNCFDKIIRNNRESIRILEEIAEQIYKEWFVRFRFPGYENCEFIDGIPRGRGKIKMQDFGFSLDTGKRPRGGIDDSIDEGVPSLGAESIDSLGFFDYTSVKYISHEFYRSMKRGHIKDGDILLYKDGAYIGKVTKFGNNFPFEKCTVNEHVFLVRADEIEYQNYLFFTLKTKEYFNLMQNLNRNAAQPGLSTNDIEGIKLLKPDLNVVKQFNEIIGPILNEIFILGKSNKKLVEQRDLLLPRLMSGKLEIK